MDTYLTRSEAIVATTINENQRSNEEYNRGIVECEVAGLDDLSRLPEARAVTALTRFIAALAMKGHVDNSHLNIAPVEVVREIQQAA